MPELPEVETVRKGITPVILNHRINDIITRQPKLRYPVPSHLKQLLPGLTITKISRRSKYLLLETELGSLIIHLGMSGRIHVIENPPSPTKHDHVDILFDHNICLRYHDPRRFGMILWTTEPLKQHPLLAKLGPEPLTRHFNCNYLYAQSHQRRIPIKQFIMDSKVVVGVGNIYASEALFAAGIHPNRAANKIPAMHYALLTDQIKTVLKKAIKAGGTTLKDFASATGQPGYFQQALFVYGRQNEPCKTCQTSIKKIIIAQRSTFYCPVCQT